MSASNRLILRPPPPVAYGRGRTRDVKREGGYWLHPAEGFECVWHLRTGNSVPATALEIVDNGGRLFVRLKVKKTGTAAQYPWADLRLVSFSEPITWQQLERQLLRAMKIPSSKRPPGWLCDMADNLRHWRTAA